MAGPKKYKKDLFLLDYPVILVGSSKGKTLMDEEDKLSGIVPPHGGRLTSCLVSDIERLDLLNEAKTLNQVILTSKEASDLLMIAMGAFSPLEGFMTSDDYRRVVTEMRLSSGLLWPIPVTLSVSNELASSIKEGQEIALADSGSNEIMATMTVEDKYSYDKRKEVQQVFGTDDEKHPGVGKIFEQGEIYLGGLVQVISEGDYPMRFAEYARPAEVRAIFAEKGWTTIAAFQTRNPLHRSHEYLTKIALEVCDGLFIHPIVGKLKTGDIPADVRLDCYNVLLDNYYPQDRVVLKVYPMEMRYGGPREAILHAIIRQNFGCSHLIVGRDHAGVGSYYGPFDAQKIFDEINPGELQIQPLKLDLTFWCNKCGSMASPKTCPHSSEDHLSISGTKLREMLTRGETPPEQFSRKEVIDVLIKYYQSQDGN